jgi:hypothetical protein
MILKYIDTAVLWGFIPICLLMNGMIVGPFSIRIYATVFSLVYVVFRGGKVVLSAELLLYIGFILSSLLALYMNGEIVEANFSKYFLGRYLVCFVSVMVLSFFIKDSSNLIAVISILLGVGVLNGIVTSLQFIGHPAGGVIPLFLNPMELAQENLTGRLSDELMLGKGGVGLFSSTVKNGYLSAAIAALSPIVYERANKKWVKMGALSLFFFLYLVVFMTQQRFAFLLVSCFILFYGFKNKALLYRMLPILIIGGIYLSFVKVSFDSENLGRISALSDDNRIEIYSFALNFIKEHLFFGGKLAFGEAMDAAGFGVLSAHNFFLNAFIYGGLLGGLIITVLYFKMLLRIAKVLFKREFSNRLNPSFFIAAALGIYLMNSLTHNASLVTGSEFIWVLYILLVKSVSIESSRTRKTQNSQKPYVNSWDKNGVK